MSFEVTEQLINSLSKRHRWAATGVADYPPRDPLVGQSRFFKRFRNFLQTVDHDDDHFAHVFAVEAEWGRGKSRLGHELVAQINDCSRGWYVREADSGLTDQQLFDLKTQDHYLALYIRYSQVASDYQNSDNWFAYGLYKALLPLATKVFDGSIQSEIAKQALQRLEPVGFMAGTLADKLQLSACHSEEALYDDPVLLVQCVQAAYEYLKEFGIQYVLVVLDELETVAEAATFGLEHDETKRLDGQAIRLIGKAIKEEDPRRKLPWLRYVALCSPLLGQQLREIQSVARRFELVELEHNAFADVSDYVASLAKDGKLGFEYPQGLVEAAYAMSGANFGWFNVIMANVDAVLEQFQQAGKAIPEVGELFTTVLESSGRVAEHVLDAGAIEGINTRDQSLLSAVRSLLYGQLPIALDKAPANSSDLLKLNNEDGEPVASLYRKLPLDRLLCRQALEQAKFRRDKEEWIYPAVDQALSLDTLLDNLRTFAINESDGQCLLVPLAQAEFKYLLGLLYDHPAIEFAADALWQKLIGDERFVPDSEATHIGPSVAMLLRLDLRYRSAQRNSMIFRDPAHADSHEKAMQALMKAAGKQPQLRLQARLTGLMRLLDNNWLYNQPLYPNKQDLVIQTEPRAQGAGQRGGLLICDAFKLHPEGKAWFAWASNREELDKLHTLVSSRRSDDGRIPVMVFTASTHLMEQYSRGDVSDAVRDDLLLYYLNQSEVDQLERIGLSVDSCHGFRLHPDVFTGKFKNKLNAIQEFAYQAMHKWRARLGQRGLIVWPLKVSGKLNAQDRELLCNAWKLMAFDVPSVFGLMDIEKRHGIDAEEVSSLLQKLAIPGKLLAQGFTSDEHAGLFSELANPQLAIAQVPLFLTRIAHPGIQHKWTLVKAKQEWYWGYLTQTNGLTAKTVFDDWMWWCEQLHLLQLEDAQSHKAVWSSYPRAKLGNAIDEANLWFTGKGPGDYPTKVAVLTRVFGYDRIPGLFAPLGHAPIGTETVEAKEQLSQAANTFKQLKLAEEALTQETSLTDIADDLPALLKKRADILRAVSQVRPLNPTPVSIASVHTLKLDDKSQSLYVRIEQARLFAEFVERSAEKIQNRTNQLINEVEAECSELPHFPKTLYTLSLQTVANILKGALESDDTSGTSMSEGTASSDTLLHYLRSLNLEKAAERLAQLAEEAGINLDSENEQAFAEVNGHILSSYRVAKEHYAKTHEFLSGLKNRCSDLTITLEPFPIDYAEKDHPALLISLNQKLILIADAFEDLPGDANREREKLREPARKGQFSGIRDVPDKLFGSIRTQLHPVGGELNKIDYAIKAYKETKILKINVCLPLLEPLFCACGSVTPEPVTVQQLEDLSLADVGVLIDVNESQWQQEAEKLLADTELSFMDWQDVAKAILEEQEPSITEQQRQQLVSKGILKMRLTFGAHK